jgi:hypothetical protein
VIAVIPNASTTAPLPSVQASTFPDPFHPVTNLSYQRSPQCTSSVYAALQNGGTFTFAPQSIATYGTTVLTYPEVIATATSELRKIQNQYPGPCCGNCEVYFREVSVTYWAVPGTSTDCLATMTNSDPFHLGSLPPLAEDPRTAVNTGNIIPKRSAGSVVPLITPSPKIPARMLEPRLATIGNGSTYVGADGFTYYSPYIYIQFATIDARDNCGFLGGKYTSITWSFLPDEISTIEGLAGVTKSFNFADLPCPPADLKARLSSIGAYDGSWSYSPVIAPPAQLTRLDPAWASCIPDDLNGYDPPHVLTPASVLAFTTPPIPTVIPTPINPAPIQNPPNNPANDPPPAWVPTQATAMDPMPIHPSPPAPPQQTSSQSPKNNPPPPNPLAGDNEPSKQPPQVSFDPNVVATPNQPIPPKSTPTPPPPPAIVISSQTLTLTPGAAPITVGTSTIAYSSGSVYINNSPAAAVQSGSVVVISNKPIATLGPVGPAPPAPVISSFGGILTIISGKPTIVGAVPVTLGSAPVTTTIPASVLTIPTGSPGAGSVITIPAIVLTIPAAPATVTPTPGSPAPSAPLVIGDLTFTPAAAPATSGGVGIGGAIMSAFSTPAGSVYTYTTTAADGKPTFVVVTAGASRRMFSALGVILGLLAGGLSVL